MTTGIHHITAIASDAKQCVDFFTRVLGLRLVKKSVNQDDVSTYHLFFGDRMGNPGMDLTHFIFLPSAPGRQGNGLVTTVSFAITPDALSFWQKRFKTLGIPHADCVERFGAKRLPFTDPDGMQYELVSIADTQSGNHDVWETKEISKDPAIRNFFSATLSVPEISLIDPVLTGVFGYTKGRQEGSVVEYSLSSQLRASRLEVIVDPHVDWGRMGAGTVHHIAFRAAFTDEQIELRERVVALGLTPTDSINRYYFRSVYFRTPAGILFEIATDEPGFTADEPEQELGKHLALPPFLEAQRASIESQLIPLK